MARLHIDLPARTGVLRLHIGEDSHFAITLNLMSQICQPLRKVYDFCAYLPMVRQLIERFVSRCGSRNDLTAHMHYQIFAKMNVAEVLGIPTDFHIRGTVHSIVNRKYLKLYVAHLDVTKFSYRIYIYKCIYADFDRPFFVQDMRSFFYPLHRMKPVFATI